MNKKRVKGSGGSKSVSIRFKKTEYDALTGLAEAFGYKNISELIRAAIRNFKL